MTWEETIREIRRRQDFKELVKLAYLDEDLKGNVERFIKSTEWKETEKLIAAHKAGKLRVLDMGCGNGIAAVAFALGRHEVVAVDPDDSITVGTGAVLHLKHLYGLDNLEVVTGYAEKVDLQSESFDLVYCRQSMHHANDLEKFVSNCSTFLKKGGIMITVRDHVVWGKKDKKLFLKTHALHKFYGGENAFSDQEYATAFERAGLRVVIRLKHFDSVINYYPLSPEQVEQWRHQESDNIRSNLKKKLGMFGNWQLIYWLYTKLIFDPANLTNEKKVPGRMYSYLSFKK